MPMKWTPENDQRLLVKILEVTDVTLDVKAIAERWTTNPSEEAPTPRAISERLAKIRNLIRANGGSMSGSVGGMGKSKPVGGAKGGKAKGGHSGVQKSSASSRKTSIPLAKREKMEVTTSNNDGGIPVKIEKDDLHQLPAYETGHSTTESQSPDTASHSSMQEPLTPPASAKKRKHGEIFGYENNGLDRDVFSGFESYAVKETALGNGRIAPDMDGSNERFDFANGYGDYEA